MTRILFFLSFCYSIFFIFFLPFLLQTEDTIRWRKEKLSVFYFFITAQSCFLLFFYAFLNHQPSSLLFFDFFLSFSYIFCLNIYLKNRKKIFIRNYLCDQIFLYPFLFLFFHGPFVNFMFAF